MKYRVFMWMSALLLAGMSVVSCGSGGNEKNNAMSPADNLTSAGMKAPARPGANKAPQKNIALETYDAGFFTIQKPAGWQVYVAGQCSTLAFLIQDPNQPLRRCFMFSEIGPFYINKMQKTIDLQYMNSGGYPIAWIEMPVVDPLTPENFLAHFKDIADTQIARQFMPAVPRLDNIQIVSSGAQPSPYGGNLQTSLMRAVYEEKGAAGEGLFLVSVGPFVPFTNMPGGGNAFALSFTGISAPQDEFASLQASLLSCVRSFNLNPQYVQDCLRQQEKTGEALLKAGKTLSETADIIMDGWEKRNQADDIIAAKRSDAILGNERLYDPDTGQVYEFENGFYDKYNPERQNYKLFNLQPLPDDDHALWTAPAMDGYRALGNI